MSDLDTLCRAPIASISSSTFRVDTPWTSASATTLTIASSHRRRGSTKDCR